MFIRETTRPEKEKKIDIYIGDKYAGIGNTTAHLRFNSLEINITQIWGKNGKPTDARRVVSSILYTRTSMT